MVLYLVGLGMGDARDVTIRGKEAIQRCTSVFLEAYTSVLGVSQDDLEAAYGKSITIADRTMVESEAEDRMIRPAATEDVALLVVGDPLSATTHTDFVIRAREMGVVVEIIHNTSIMTAVGACGLQLYNYGQTVSIPFFRDEWQPDSFYDKIKFNMSGELHTLALLDIKVKEPDFEAMCRGKTAFLPPRYMTVNTAIEQLLLVEDKRAEGVLSRDTVCVGLARMGQPTQQIVSGTMAELLEVDFGAPLHSLVIVGGEVHDLEKAMLDSFAAVKKDSAVAAPPSAPAGTEDTGAGGGGAAE